MSSKSGDRDSWLKSRPPWSLSQSAPLRPTSTSNLSSTLDVVRAFNANSPMSILGHFLRMRNTLELEEITFLVAEDVGIKLGEGTTYVVEKRPLPEKRLISEHKWVAVKRSKCIIPKDPNKAVAMPFDSLRRLRTVLLEIEILLHPPLRSHPNIARLLGYSWDHDAPGYTPSLIMELASHGTLAQFLRTEHTGNDERRELCLDVALGLEALHSSMIIHGDVKQDNVLVFPHAQRKFIAKLSDFGLALLGEVEPVYRGTPVYNAPEVHLQGHQMEHQTLDYQGKISTDRLTKCDVFSFGLLAFEVLMGGQRYYDLPETATFRETMVAAHGHLDLLDLALEFSRHPALPSEFTTLCQSIFQQTLCSSPERRLQNGWDGMKSLFGMRLPDHASPPEELSQILRKSENNRHSMLEIHFTVTFSGDLLKCLIAELILLTEIGESREEKAQASFDLCLMSTIANISGIFIDDTPLDWLTKAVFLGHKTALGLGHRLFDACQVPLPDHFQRDARNPFSHELEMKGKSEIEWYSKAVQLQWGENIRTKTLHNVQQLVTDRQGSSNSHEKSTGSFGDADKSNPADNHFMLHLSVLTGNTHNLQHLLEHGADVNQCTPDGLTALHLASIMGNLEQIRIILSFGADASINDGDNVSPLHWLVLFRSEEVDAVTEILVRAGAKVNSCIDSGGRKYFDDLGLVLVATPLWWAVTCRNHTVISALLVHNADIFYEYSQKDKHLIRKGVRPSCIDAALGTVCADTLELLLQHNSLPSRMKMEEKEMCYRNIGSAASNKFQRWCIHGKDYESAFTKVLTMLHHFNIEYTDDFDMGVTPYTPLLRASISCNIPLAKALIQHGADVNYRPVDNSGTAIEMTIYAAWHMSDIFATIELTRLLLDSGATTEPAPLNPNGSDEELWRSEQWRRGVLHLAVTHGAGIPLVRFLLQRVPEQINQRCHGKPILSRVIAAYDESDACQVASLLLNARADLDAETDHWEGKRWNCCLTAAATGVQFKDWRFLKFCLDHNSTLEIGKSGSHGKTLLHFAIRKVFQVEYRAHIIKDKIRRSTLEFIDLLLSHPRSVEMDLVNKPDFAGITPLMYATAWALPECVALLLEHGADIQYEYRGKCLTDVIEGCYNSVLLEFVVPDELYDETKRVHSEETEIRPCRQSEYLSRLDEIRHLTLNWTFSNEATGSAVAQNTSLPLRLMPSKPLL